MTTPIWGKPKYETTYKKVKTLADGETVQVRILPPMKSLAAKGEGWMQFHKQHFGYEVQRRDDPSKRMARPFACPERKDYNSGRISVTCPECDLRRERLDTLTATIALAKSQKKSEEEIEALTASLSGWLEKHNLDSKYYVNVKYADGTYGTFKFGSKARKQLKGLIDGLVKPTAPGKKPQDPIDPEQGVWFEFHRVGKFRQAETTVSIVREPVERDGESYEVIKKAPLTQQDAELSQEPCYDLADVGIRVLSLDRIELLVKSSGDPEEVEAIFQTPERAEQSPTVDRTPRVTVATNVQAALAAGVPAVTVSAPFNPSVKTTPASTVVAASTLVSKVAVPIDPTEIDEATFMALYGPKQ